MHETTLEVNTVLWLNFLQPCEKFSVKRNLRKFAEVWHILIVLLLYMQYNQLFTKISFSKGGFA